MADKIKRPLLRRPSFWILAALLTPVLCVGGFFGYRYGLQTNFDTVVPEKVYRSAQPSPAQITRWVEAYGLKTIVNLRRDAAKTGLADETAAAVAAGATLINVRLPDRELPDRADLLQLAEVLETAPRPILLHCKMGADRAGIASVMAAMAIGDKPYAVARGQLDLFHFHIDSDPAHIGGVLMQYEDWCRKHQRDTGGWKEFRAWLATDYHGKS
jgi:protein tyrosine/serine phosphatase